MAAQSRSFLQVAATEEASPPLRVVQMEGLVLLKIIKHCQEFSPALVTGQLLGLDVGSVLEVTNCFPFPIREEDEEVEAEGANYQLEMMRCLREVNVDNNTVGWYQSTSFGSFQTVELIETFMNYQENIRRCVCIVYDPSRSNQGVLALKALKLSDSFMDLYKNNNFTGEKLREKNLSWADIFEEIPVNNFKEDEKDDCSDDYDNSDKDEYNNDGDDDHGNHDEDTDVESENEEEGGGSENDNDDEQKDDEMEELEIEYKKLLNEEQDLSRNLKGHKDDDIKKGQAVKNQRALWDKTLEFRFLLQKAFSSSNRLPQEPVRSLFFDSDNGVSEAFSDLITSSKMTLDSILELQQALVENNPSIAQSVDANSLKDSKQSVAFGNLNGDVDEEWLHISQMHTRMTSFRNESIDKWQRKTQVTTGAAAIKGKLHAFNQNISEQVVAYMRDPSKMIKGMQQNRLDVAVFGNVAVSTNTTTREDTNANASGDHELLDDSEFYQQLLKEFFETIDPASSETTFYAMKRLQTKKRKIVDRRASKSRKIRYHVHEKIVNFMAPRPMNLSHDASMTFQNLFGLRIQKSASTV